VLLTILLLSHGAYPIWRDYLSSLALTYVHTTHCPPLSKPPNERMARSFSWDLPPHWRTNEPNIQTTRLHTFLLSSRPPNEGMARSYSFLLGPTSPLTYEPNTYIEQQYRLHTVFLLPRLRVSLAETYWTINARSQIYRTHILCLFWCHLTIDLREAWGSTAWALTIKIWSSGGPFQDLVSGYTVPNIFFLIYLLQPQTV
jgi:hypothetical protein